MAWRNLRGQKLAVFSLWVIGLFVLASGYGEIVYWRYHITDARLPAVIEPARELLVQVLDARDVAGQPPPYDVQDLDKQYAPPSLAHPMGTDGLGRDVMQRVIQGARIAFRVGIVTSLIAIPIGMILGCLAGYFGGWLDDLVGWLYTTFASMPTLLFVLAISVVVERGLLGVYLGIGLTTWVGLCRLIRGEVMKHKERTYVRACKALGIGPFRTIFRHILPNVAHIIIITFSLRFPSAIGTEVIMSYLGIGVQGEPSWGIMIGSARLRLWHGVWWELAFTTIAIFVVVLAFNLLGDALRDMLDPRLRRQTNSG
jgi:peptide/nickel transport system permease protein